LGEAIARQYDIRNTTASLARVFRDWFKSRIFEFEPRSKIEMDQHRHMIGSSLPAAALAEDAGAIEARLEAFAYPNMVEPPPSIGLFSNPARDSSTTYRVFPPAAQSGEAHRPMAPPRARN
jgi:hypothetical protein